MACPRACLVIEARDALAEKPFPRRILAAGVDGEKKRPIGARRGEVARSVADHQHAILLVFSTCRQLQVVFFRAHFLAGDDGGEASDIVLAPLPFEGLSRSLRDADDVGACGELLR